MWNQITRILPKKSKRKSCNRKFETLVEDSMEEDNLELDQKSTKRSRRTLNRKSKKKSEVGIEEENEEGGSKIAVAFVTFIIVIIWLAIFALLVKWDVGGFGSTVLSPILKNVPYVNKILPVDKNGITSTDSSEYPYQTLDEAVAYIKQLELQIQSEKESSTENQAYVAQLEAEVSKLQQYEQNQASFETEKAQFYNDVVFNDNAPSIDEYKKYYESIDSSNAEVLYKEVVGQEQTDSEVKKYATTYSQMKPKEAAAIFDTMTDNLDLVAKILSNMDSQSSASILGQMDSATAAKITEIMQPSE